jgi:hypothetical protein
VIRSKAPAAAVAEREDEAAYAEAEAA